MSVHVQIDAEKCLGNGMCEAIAPAVFAVDEYGESRVLQPEALDGDFDLLEEAMNSCPARAILVRRGE